MGEDRSKNASNDAPIRVLLADDHAMFREGLAGLLASCGGMKVVGSIANGEEAVALAQSTRPDVVLMQVQMPFESAVATLEAMRAFSEPPKVVIVTMFESPHYVRELTGVGASAYVLKTSSSEHLLAVVRAAVLGPQADAVVLGMPRELLARTEEGGNGSLTARELEILLLAARGLSNREIAGKLHIAEVTAGRHLANTYSKMGVSSRGEATRMALQEDWITIKDVTDDLD